MAEIISVSALNRYVKTLLESDSVLDGLAVRGEIAGFVHHLKTGHYYFSLRDGQCSVRAVMFSRDAQRVPFTPENGMKVILRGRVSLFERDGAFQLYVEEMIPDGVGAMQLALDQLKYKLQQEGLFDSAHKKAIPTEPHCIGVVTSATGAALQDICNVLQRRWPLAKVLLADATVQGSLAAVEVPRGIAMLDADGRADVIIVARGGGSKEDLWVFNDEQIARAAYACKMPLISAIGHEIDTCILDFVADMRAPTPSAAAELCTPNKTQVLQKLQLLQKRFSSTIDQKWNSWFSAYKKQQQAFLSYDGEKQLELRQKMLKQYRDMLTERVQQKYTIEHKRLQGAASLCASLNPYQVLARGYSIVRSETGEILGTKDTVEINSKVFVQRFDEQLECVVKSISKVEGEPK